MVTDGDAVTVAPVVALNPVDGFHVYVNAPEAVSPTDPDGQMSDDDGVIVTTGNGFTVTVTVVVETHPLAAVPVTV